MDLRSTAFDSGETIPGEYTCSGAGISPPLAWSGAPENTATFALIVTDTDAPRGAYTHWLLYNLPASVHSLPADVPPTQQIPNGGWHGRNTAGRIGYSAPCPPRGDPPHHYQFTLYAADTAIRVRPQPDKGAVLDALRGHIVGQARLEGLYGRQPD
jgi:Raf kinase inhibitor-like YbhB/YbcL family protein